MLAALVSAFSLLLATAPGAASAATPVKHVSTGAVASVLEGIGTVRVPHATLRVRSAASVAKGSNANPPYLCPNAVASRHQPGADVIEDVDANVGTARIADVSVEVFVYASTAAQAAASAEIRANYRACPKGVQEFYDLSGKYEVFTRVARTPYAVPGWKGVLLVQNAKPAHSVARAFDGYLGRGNLIVHLRWAGPAHLASATAMRASYNALAKALSTRLAKA
jgi:hypothetical protein